MIFSKYKLIQVLFLFPVQIIMAQTDTTDLFKDTVTVQVYKSNQVYKLKPAVDIPIVATGTIWSLYAFTKIYSKGAIPEEKILSLNKDDINGFDRWAVYPYSKSYDDISYYPFYAAMPLPFVFFLTGERTRNDFWKLSFLYWETMSVTGLFGTGGTYFVDRYRPYTYSSETPMDKRTSQNGKNSFYAGHVEVVASSTFFISKVYSDYYPESEIKWLFYGVASVATGTTAFLRLRGGQHFPSDILLGTTMGVLTGILVPQAHKNRMNKNHEMGLLPFRSGDAYGLSFSYVWK
jgi:membrane-associated phospholipid phosphatase